MSLSEKEIPVAYYIKKINECLAKNEDIVESIANNANDLASKVRDALFDVGVDLAEMIQLSLMSKENLKSADEKVPKSTTPVMVERASKSLLKPLVGLLPF